LEEEEVLENSFFLDPALASAECEKLIVKWMCDQVDSLRLQNMDGKLNITARKLG